MIIAALLFAAGFTKAHALVWILGLGVYTVVRLYREGRLVRMRPALAICATILFVLLAPFYLHQESLSHGFRVAEKQPRLNSMPLEIRHGEGATIHGVLRTVYSFFDVYQPLLVRRMVRSQVVLLAVLFALLCLFALRRRQAWSWWIMAAAMAAVWLPTASYDVRNLFPTLSLLCILAGIGLTQVPALSSHRSRWLPSLVSVVIILAFCGNFVVGRIREMSTLVRPYTNLSFGLWSTPRTARLHVLNPEWDALARLLNQCPTTRRANYIYCQNSFYRYLGIRGAYKHRDFGLEDLADGDLLMNECERDSDTAWFTPIAALALPPNNQPSLLIQSPRWGMLGSHDSEPFRELCMSRPKFQPSSCRLQNPQSLEVTSAGAAALATLQGQGTVDLRIEALQGMKPGDSAIVRLAIDGDAEGLSLIAHPSLSLTNELSHRLLSTAVPGGVHYLLWLNGGTIPPKAGVLLQLHKLSARPLVIRNVFVAG